ncbi:MAG TPA: galactose ABC transporter substrate-binding protein [Clostridia bacterium]|nr:galactose ABC transporter substrate-binding protein [Clostridia bacterium]
MKKALAVLMVLAMALTVFACDKGGKSGELNVSVFFYDYSDTYIGSVRAAMEQGLKDANIAYTFYDAASDQAKQTTQVETALTSGSNLLIVNIVTTGSDEAAQNIVDAAKAKDIPVIFFNREVSDAVVNSYEKCCFVGTDADEAGYMQGQMIYDFLSAEGNMAKYDLNADGKINYLMFRGELGNAEAFGRTLYSVQNANTLFGSAVLAPSAANQTDSTQPADGISPYYLYGNWSAANAKNLMDTALTTYSLTNGDIEIVIANNDDQALGAIESMNEKGFNTGEAGAGYIPVFGVDATAVAQDAIANGKMTGTIKQDAQGMAEGIFYLLRNVAAGKAVMADTEGFNVDEGVAKIRIPYAIFTGDGSAVPPEEPAATLNVSVFFYDYSDTYIGSVRAAFETLLKDNAVAYTFYDGASDQSKQFTQVETALTQGSNLLIVNIVTTGSDEAAQNIVDAAKAKDIPVIFFNREVSDAVVNSYEKCCFVGTDADEAGYMQGQMIYDFLSAEGNMAKYDLNADGKINYLMFRGELGNAEAFGRTLYSVQNANTLFGSAVLAPSAANQTDSTQPADGISPYYLYGNWSAANAKNLMDTALTTYSLTNGDIEIVIANNDDQALGAIESMNEKGFNTGEAGAGYIPVFGVDATAVAQDAIANGKMTGTIKQDAQGMAEGIFYLLRNVAAGKAVMADTEGFNVDEGVAKIRIPYAIFTGA